MEKFVILADLQTALTAVLKKLREWIEKQGFMKNPEKEGAVGQILATDGKGGRYWKNEEKGNSVSSWNDLTDRPFYETPDGGDTLTWDGNTEGLEAYDIGGGLLYNVFDGYRGDITEDMLATMQGMTFIDISYIGDGAFVAMAVIDGGGGNGSDLMVGIYGFPTDNYEADELVIPHAGIWATSAFTLIVPGYTGFPSVKQLDAKYLPMQSIVDVVLASVPAAEGGSF